MAVRPGVVYALVALSLLLVPGGGASVSDVTQQVESPQVERDSTLLRVDLRADGSAVWTVSHRTRLDDPNETVAFENLARDIQADPTNYTARFARRMGATAAAAANATGREMRIENLTVTAETTALPAQYGILSYRFEWIGFARVDGNRLTVGDTLSGLFLDEETQLLVTWPDGYRVVEADPVPTERREDAVVWSGPAEFGSGEPRVDLAPASAIPFGSARVGLVVVVLVAVLAAGVLYAVRGSEDGHGGPARAASAEVTGGGSHAEPEPETESEPESPEGLAVLPPELLSNEEQVVRALRVAGGRMRQQALVAELDWTEAKTSQVLRGLREDGTVESFRLGRENVLRLAAEDEEVPDDRS